MKFGVTIFLNRDTISVTDLARACEDLGFESLFLPEHTHIPVDRRSKYTPAKSMDLPREFRDVFDPLLPLASAAAVTSTLLLGTGLCLAAQRDPIILAKEVSTLDVLSDGRVLLGVGPGWNREEMRNHGLDPSVRYAVLGETIEAMKRIWTLDVAEYHGEHIRFDGIWQWPKPLQSPHPPVLMGGSGPTVLQRVVRYGDGWLASATREEHERLSERVRELRELERRNGRERLPVTLQRADSSPTALESYRDAGIDRCTFGLPSGGYTEVATELRRLSDVLRTLHGEDEGVPDASSVHTGSVYTGVEQTEMDDD